MSSKRRSPESVVVQFFMAAEPDLALTMYRIVRGILEQRNAFKPGARPTRPPRRAPSIGLPLTGGDASSPKLA